MPIRLWPLPTTPFALMSATLIAAGEPRNHDFAVGYHDRAGGHSAERSVALKFPKVANRHLQLYSRLCHVP